MNSIPDTPKNVHENLKEWMRARKLTQKDLARTLGISEQSFSHYIASNIYLPTRYILKLADIYGMSNDELANIFIPSKGRSTWGMSGRHEDEKKEDQLNELVQSLIDYLEEMTFSRNGGQVQLSTSEIVDIFLQPAANRAHRVQEAMHA